MKFSHKALSLPTFFLALFLCSCDARSFGRCKEYEQIELEKAHLICTQQVEQRYSVILQKFEVDIPPPHGSGYRNFTKPPKRVAEPGEICNMLHDAVEKCGQLYQHCFDDIEYRRFLDGQLELTSHLLTTLYNLGDEVNQCEAIQELERSGRKDVAYATEMCKEDAIKKLTIKYQQCMEDANYDMTRRMVGHQGNFDLAFAALCEGLDTVVHGCSVMLYDCYTIEEIEETKLGQLELMRKVFIDLVEDTSKITVAPSFTSTEASGKKIEEVEHWDFDITKCAAFRKNQNYYFYGSTAASMPTTTTMMLLLLTSLICHFFH